MKLFINKAIFDALSETEKNVIAYINNHEQDILKLSITDIAENTYTSIATVSRTIQKCGFQGIAELRYRMKDKDGEHTNSNITNEIIAKSYRECTKTFDNLRITSILKCAEYIEEGKIVYIFARGFTTLVAEEFQMQLQLLGFHTVIVSDVIWMKHCNTLSTKEDVVVILSVINSTPELAESANIIKKIGAKIIVCTCKDHTTLTAAADVVVLGYSEEIMKARGISIQSHVPLFLITKIILEYLSEKNVKKVIN